MPQPLKISEETKTSATRLFPTFFLILFGTETSFTTAKVPDIVGLITWKLQGIFFFLRLPRRVGKPFLSLHGAKSNIRKNRRKFLRKKGDKKGSHENDSQDGTLRKRKLSKEIKFSEIMHLHYGSPASFPTGFFATQSQESVTKAAQDGSEGWNGWRVTPRIHNDRNSLSLSAKLVGKTTKESQKTFVRRRRVKAYVCNTW